ncbi:MAG TPA: SGNH/GDSL hydrolase family protein [Thermoanaerobaculia bacterium]|nr:SGNH/GDSL hydrolase family protein [Thermoanaerobaculia bacterium]
MRLRTNALLALLLAAAVAAPRTAAQPDFTRFVALGDSLAAGFISGGLAIHPQERSAPALVARQAGVTDFQQPLISEPGIPPLLAIQGFAGGTPIIAPRSNQPGAPLNLNLPRPYNNLAVPGFDVKDVQTTVTGNVLIDIILRGQGPALAQAMALQPTFGLVWIGNNDVLGAATSGVVIEGVTLTTPAEFEINVREVFSAFPDIAGASLVVATLPDVTVIPFVTTVPPVVVNPATREPVLGPNGQPIPLIGPDGPLAPNDRVLLSATSLLAQGIGLPAAVGGTNQPLPDRVVLSAAEVATIQARVALFNQIIRDEAGRTDAAVADINALLDQAATTGIPVGGNIVLTTDFLTGGIFSYDGVHPTPLGNALAANEFIRAINQTFDGDIPPVDLIPFLFGPDGSAGATIELPGLLEGTPVFSDAAYEALRLSLRVPSPEELARLKERPRSGPDPDRGPGPREVPRLDGGVTDSGIRSVTSGPR